MLQHLLSSRRISLSALGLALLLAVTGCGGTAPVPVKGKLVLPQGYNLVETDNVQITFQPEDETGRGGTAEVNAKDGTFVANSASRKGVIPGKYKIAVKITPYPGMKESKERQPAFDTLNKSFDVAKSKLSCEIAPGAEQTLTIDLGKGAVTKN